MSHSNSESSPDLAFISHLVTVCKDRGNSSHLRRFWSSTTRHYAYPILGRLGALSQWGTDQPKPIVAALYALNPNHVLNGSSLGQALLRLAGGGENAPGFESFERHFCRLLSSDIGTLDDVADQLHRLFKRLERETIPVDYHQLLWDLRKWIRKSDDVKSRWASDFYLAPDSLGKTAQTPLP